MRIKRVVLGLAVMVFVLHILSLIFTNNPHSAQTGLKGAAWGMRALAGTEFGKLFFILLDSFVIFVLIKLWFKK